MSESAQRLNNLQRHKEELFYDPYLMTKFQLFLGYHTICEYSAEPTLTWTWARNHVNIEDHDDATFLAGGRRHQQDYDAGLLKCQGA